MEQVAVILGQILEFLLEVIKHLLGTTDGVSLLALVAVAVVKTLGDKDKELEEMVLVAFNKTEKVMEVLQFATPEEKMAAKIKRFLEEFTAVYQDKKHVSPPSKVLDKALVKVAKPAHERKLAGLVKLLATLKGIK